MHVATQPDGSCDMQIDDDNSKMMTAIMRMVSGEFYAGYIHMHQMPDICGGYGGGTIHKVRWVARRQEVWWGTRFWHPGQGD